MESIEPKQLSYWYDACGAELVLYARGWLDEALAEDAVQEVFIRLMAQRRRPDNVRAWLYRCVRNEAISRLRRRISRRKHHEKLAARQKDWFESSPDDLIDAQTAQQVLQSLPETQREIVTLRIWGQMSLKEIAALVDMPVSTVHHRYQTALETMKKKMETSCKTTKN